jgi:hypothetical protein
MSATIVSLHSRAPGRALPRLGTVAELFEKNAKAPFPTPSRAPYQAQLEQVNQQLDDCRMEKCRLSTPPG